MTSLLLPAVLAFLVVLFGMPSLIMVAKRKHLVDEPSEARTTSNHHAKSPMLKSHANFEKEKRTEYKEKTSER